MTSHYGRRFDYSSRSNKQVGLYKISVSSNFFHEYFLVVRIIVVQIRTVLQTCQMKKNVLTDWQVSQKCFDAFVGTKRYQTETFIY
jgi:hypothetical protein